MDPRGLSDTSDCTTALLEDLDGLVFLFSMRTESEVFLSGSRFFCCG